MTLPPKPTRQEKTEAAARAEAAKNEAYRCSVAEGEALRVYQSAKMLTAHAENQVKLAEREVRRLALTERLHAFPEDVIAVLRDPRSVKFNRENVQPFTRRGLIKVTSERFYGTRYDWTSDALTMMDILKGTQP